MVYTKYGINESIYLVGRCVVIVVGSSNQDRNQETTCALNPLEPKRFADLWYTT